MPTLEDIGSRLAGGASLTPADGEALAASDNLLGLGALAEDCCRRRNGERVTFVRVHEVRADAAGGSALEIPEAAGEVRITGVPAEPDGWPRLVEQVATAAGAVPVTGFALDDIVAAAAGDPDAVAGRLAALRAAGLSLLAEARLDRLPGPQWLDAAAAADLPVARLTVAEAAGDAAEASLAAIHTAASWGAALAQVHAFAPLPRRLAAQPTTGFRDLRQVALARLLVENVDSIQVDWNLYGHKLAQVALLFGASDVDAVEAGAGGAPGARRAPAAEVRRNIEAAARTPVERNGCFEALEQ